MRTKALGMLAAVLTIGIVGCGASKEDESEPEAHEQAFSISSTLATGQHRPTQMAVDATHVYWSVYKPADDAMPFIKHYDVLRVAKTGGAVQVLATNEVELTSLTVDETHVYWLNQSDDCGQSTERKGAARRVTKNASAPATNISSTTTTCADFKGITNGSVVVDAKNIYYTGEQGVRMLPKDGSAAVSLFAEAGPNPHASTKSSVLLLQDETTIYFGDSYGPAYAKPKAPGSTATKILDEAPWDAAIDATHLYWVKDGKVMRIAKNSSGTTPQEIGPAGFNHVTAITVDDQDVYYSNTVDKAIRRIKKTGATSSRLFTSNETAYALAIDGTSLFFPHYGIEYMDFMVPGYVAKSGTIRKRTLR